jgi:hypothetical protein
MKLELSQIKRDGGTQARLNLNHEAVEDYSAAMKEGAEFPPAVVFHDGKDYWLADGFHRCAAADYAGINSIEAEVRTGSRREALRYALGANKQHGVRPTREDKRHAVNLALDDAELCELSNYDLAGAIGVSEGFIRKVKRERCVHTHEANDRYECVHTHPKDIPIVLLNDADWSVELLDRLEPDVFLSGHCACERGEDEPGCCVIHIRRAPEPKIAMDGTVYSESYDALMWTHEKPGEDGDYEYFPRKWIITQENIPDILNSLMSNAKCKELRWEIFRSGVFGMAFDKALEESKRAYIDKIKAMRPGGKHTEEITARRG